MRRSAIDGVTAEADLAQCGALALPPPFLFLWLLVQFFFTAPFVNESIHLHVFLFHLSKRKNERFLLLIRCLAVP